MNPTLDSYDVLKRLLGIYDSLVGVRLDLQWTQRARFPHVHDVNSIHQNFTFCLLGNFPCFFCSLLIFVFQINLKKLFQHYKQIGKQFRSRSARHYVGPDMDVSCLQRFGTAVVCK